MEDLVYGFVEGLGYSEGQGQGWVVLAGLDSYDGLAGNTDLVGQLLLGHFIVIEPQPANLVAESVTAHLLPPTRIESVLPSIGRTGI